MATFNLKNLPSDISQKDIKQIAAYLYKLNEQLTYMFGNITPEDNYSQDAYLKYVKQGEQITAMEMSLGQISLYVQENTNNINRLQITVSGISLEMVKKGEVVSAINMSEEEIKILANKIKLEGIVTANENFKVLEDGSIVSVNGTFSGTVDASTIKGSTISGGTVTGSYIYGAYIEGSEIGDESGNFYTDGYDVYIGGFMAYETFYGKYLATIDSEKNGIGDNYKYAVWTGWDGDEAAAYITEYGEISCSEIYSEVADESWSDSRLKDNIAELDPELMVEIVRNLRPVSFVMKKHGREGVGFIAQDVYLLCEKLGCKLPLYGLTPDRKYLTIPYQNYIAVMVAVQQQTLKRMDDLEERITELERMVGNGS